MEIHKIFKKKFAHKYMWPGLYSCILIMDIINHSAGLITSFHMLDAVIRGIHPAMRLLSPTRTTTQLDVYCVLQLHLSVVRW